MVGKIAFCQFLQWDTDFFGHPIARVTSNRLDPNGLAASLSWCSTHAIDCLYFLVDADSPQTIMLAEEQGFRLVEVRMTMERFIENHRLHSAEGVVSGIAVRPVNKNDFLALERIAGAVFVHSRYRADQRFSREKWAAYYQLWIRKSCEGRADVVLVAERNEQVVGFVTLVRGKDGTQAQIELVGVAAKAQNDGVGRILLLSALNWCLEAGINYLTIVTQGRNVALQRVLQKLGFLTRNCQLYYHKWFTDKGIHK